MIVAVVLAAAAAATALLVGGNAVVGRRPRPLDTERQERWLVSKAPGRWQPALRAVDRRVAGGVIVAASFATVTVGALIVGWVLQSVDNHEGFARWDRSAAQWGADHSTRQSERILRQITNLGGTPVLVGLLGLTGLYLVVVRKRGWGVLGYLAIVAIGSLTINNILKALVNRPRPDIHRVYNPIGSSFPSGHSAAAASGWMALAMVVFALSARRWRMVGVVVAVFVALVVAASRVLLGVHWLTDVIAGLTVGWTWVALVTIAFGGRLLRFGEPAQRVAAGATAPIEPRPREDA